MNEKRKLVMADEAPMLVQQVLLPQMRLLVLLMPQVRPLVLRRRVYYHVTYFAVVSLDPCELRNMNKTLKTTSGLHVLY